LKKNYDIIIIGAGFAGATTAYQLLRQAPLDILILEKEDSYGIHASGRNAALFRQAVPNFQFATFIQETRRFFENSPVEWEGSRLLKKTGSFLLGPPASLGRLQKNLNSLRVESELFRSGEFPEGTPAPLREALAKVRCPALLHTPGDGVVDVHAYLGNLLRASQEGEATLKYGFEVGDIRREGDRWIVSGEEGEWATPVVVNSAGAWAGGLGKAAGLNDQDLIPFRRHLFVSETLPWVSDPWPFVWDIQNEFYFRPESGGLLLCPGDEDPHPPEEPVTDPGALSLLAEKIQNHFSPLEEISVARGWSCLRTKGPEGGMVLGSEPQAPGFFWVAGLGGHGVSASYGIGREASRQIFDYLNEKSFFGERRDSRVKSL